MLRASRPPPMSTTLATPPRALAAYAANLSRSHRDWLLTVRLPGAPGPGVDGQPLRRLVLEGDDLVLEYGRAPGRPQRLRMAGPFAFQAHRTGLELELCLEGPRGSRPSVVLSPPPRG